MSYSPFITLIDNLIFKFPNTNFKIILCQDPDELESIDFSKVKLGQKIASSTTKMDWDLVKFGKLLGKFHWNISPQSQSAFTCSKLTIETLEQDVKYVQN